MLRRGGKQEKEWERKTEIWKPSKEQPEPDEARPGVGSWISGVNTQTKVQKWIQRESKFQHLMSAHEQNSFLIHSFTQH